MAYREVSNQSWGGRLVASIGGALFGVLLFIASFPLLWWNEGRAVQTEQSLTEGAKNVVPIDNADKVDSGNEGKLVHITAKAVTEDTPADPDFHVKAPKDIRLSRTVEMYQYKEESHSETKKKLGGGEETVTTYDYKPVWSEEFLDSRNFHEAEYRGKNPSAMPYNSTKWDAKKVTAGAFELPAALVDKINDAKEYPIPGGAAPKDKDAPKATDKDAPKATDKDAPKATDKDAPKPSEKDAPKPSEKDAPKPPTGPGGAKDKDAPKPPTADPSGAMDKDAPEPPEGYEIVQGQFYKGEQPNEPEIGDVRVSYMVVEPTTVSVIAQQKGSSFGPYKAQAGDEIEMLKTGDHDAASMFTEAQENNKTFTWILRLVGFLMMAFGLFLVMNPLSVLGDVVPFIGNMVGALLAVVAGVIALGLSLITIAIAWLAYRPLLGVPLLAAGVGAIVLVFMLARRKKAPAAPAGA